MSPEDVSDFDETQDQEESSDVSGVQNSEEGSDAEEISGHEEASDVSGIQDFEENFNLEKDSVLNMVPEPQNAHIHNKIPDSPKNRANTFEKNEVTSVTPEPENVFISHRIPDLQPYLAVNLEEIMNVQAVSMPNYFVSKEVQHLKAIQFHKDDADATFLIDTTLFEKQVSAWSSHKLKVLLRFIEDQHLLSSHHEVL